MPCIAEFCVVLSAFQGIIFFLFKTTLFAKYFKWFKGFEMPYKCKLYYTPTAVVHRNHHFDTRKRLHPLNTGDASPSIRALDQATLHFMDNCRVVFSFTKKEISTRQGQYLFLFL